MCHDNSRKYPGRYTDTGISSQIQGYPVRYRDIQADTGIESNVRLILFLQFSSPSRFPGGVQQTFRTNIQLRNEAQRLHHCSTVYEHVIKN